jgi:hypothetical protein
MYSNERRFNMDIDIIIPLYLVGIVVVAIPLLYVLADKYPTLTDNMALAIFLAYPIVVVILIIKVIFLALKGLVDLTILLFKGGA